MEKTSQDDRSAPVQIHPSLLCSRRKGSAQGRDDQQGPRDIRIEQVAFQCGKYSESLRILAFEIYPKEKPMIGSNKEARSLAQSPVHEVWAKRANREKPRSKSELARPKLILAWPYVLKYEVGRERQVPVWLDWSSGHGSNQSSFPDLCGMVQYTARSVCPVRWKTWTSVEMFRTSWNPCRAGSMYWSVNCGTSAHLSGMTTGLIRDDCAIR